MTYKDICKICDGTMQLVSIKSKLPISCKCKDTFGWDPEAWFREQARIKKSEKLRNGQ